MPQRLLTSDVTASGLLASKEQRCINKGHPVDAHVHFHRRELIERTLDAAASNFTFINDRAAGLLGSLLLVETPREPCFSWLERTRRCGAWVFESVRNEPETLIACRQDRRIAIVCGRQVRCARGLEVLALGTRTEFREGLGLDETLARVLQDGALAVLPWGFGKWTGSRGLPVLERLSAPPNGEFFVGDNGGRLECLGVPQSIRTAELAGHVILPGSDPFPFAGDCERVGGFGFLADVQIGEQSPWATLRTWLSGLSGSPVRFGEALGIPRFLFNQASIQLHNRLVRGVRA